MPAGTGSRRASRWIRCGGGDGYRQEEVSSKESRRRRGGVRPDESIMAVLSPEERLDAALRVAREAFKGATLTVEEVEAAVRPPSCGMSYRTARCGPDNQRSPGYPAREESS